MRGFPFLTHSPAFIVCRFFDDGHSDRCEVIPHCSLDLHEKRVFIYIFIIVYPAPGIVPGKNCTLKNICGLNKWKNKDLFLKSHMLETSLGEIQCLLRHTYLYLHDNAL